MTNKDKKPYTPEERQAFVDSLPAEQRNDNPKEVFQKAISRAAQKQQGDKESKQ